MALPQHYIMALLTPFGRLNQVGFAMLAIGLAFAHFWVYLQIRLHPDITVWNAYTIALFAMLWMKFCVLSRRMHDTGSGGLILVPILVLAAILYLCVIDTHTMGVDKLDSPALQLIAQHGMRVPRALLIAVFVYCIRAPSETGPNGYGPEFGESKDNGRSNIAKRRGSSYLGTEPQHAYGAAGPRRSSGWAERKRPVGFGRR